MSVTTYKSFLLQTEDRKIKIDFDTNGTIKEKRCKDSCSPLKKSKDTLAKTNKQKPPKKQKTKP